jgi:hypothetical protein
MTPCVLQDGADERDKVQEEVCSMLLEYADELEQEEREMAKRQAAWEAETARLAAEQAAFEAEQAKIAAQQAEARRLAEEAAKEAARLAELNKPPPQPIKVRAGGQESCYVHVDWAAAAGRALLAWCCYCPCCWLGQHS